MSTKSDNSSRNSINGGDNEENGSGSDMDTIKATETNEERSLRVDANMPRPRLCHLKKWPHFQGYGFNLHAERAKSGQHIGKVDEDSPAQSAGLKEGDRIIEVNNVNISNENHQQVVKRIRNGLERDGKLHEDEVLLLVVDNEADDYYKKMNIIVKSDFDNILRLSTAPKPPNKSDVDSNNNKSTNSSSEIEKKLRETKLEDEQFKSSVNASHTLQVPPEQSSGSNLSTSSISSTNQHNRTNSNSSKTSNSNSTSHLNEQSNLASKSTTSTNNVDNTSKSNTPVTKARAPTNSTTPTSNLSTPGNKSINSNGIDPFQMSAAEFKNYLKSKGRNDPRVNQVDIEQKFKIFQSM